MGNREANYHTGRQSDPRIIDITCTHSIKSFTKEQHWYLIMLYVLYFYVRLIFSVIFVSSNTFIPSNRVPIGPGKHHVSRNTTSREASTHASTSGHIRLISPNMLFYLSFVILLGAAAGSNDYKYFDFTRQWSPNSCYKSPHSCKELPASIDSWTIHGLWPSEDATHYPSDCAGSSCRLNSTEIDDLVDEMIQKWPTDYKGSNTKFWSHEYCKHGTCCEDVLPTEHDYFSHALALHDKLDMDAVLAAGGLVPSLTATYHLEQMDAALKAGFGVSRATYWCRFVKEDGTSKQLLFQVSVCIDKEMVPRDCPVTAHQSCDAKKPFYILPWDVLRIGA